MRYTPIFLLLLLARTAAPAQTTACCACKDFAVTALPEQKKVYQLEAAQKVYRAYWAQMKAGGANIYRPYWGKGAMPMSSTGITCGEGASLMYYAVAIIPSVQPCNQAGWEVSVESKNAEEYAAAMLKHCNEALAAYKLPGDVLFRNREKAVESFTSEWALLLAGSEAITNKDVMTVINAETLPSTLTFFCSANSPRYTMLLREKEDKRYEMTFSGETPAE